MSSFIRPIGVHRDINELEFISALLQSHPHILRSSGTIKAIDIALYLKSRHGIIISEAVIDQYIITELAGQIQQNTTKPSDVDAGVIKKVTTTSKEKRLLDDNLHIPLDICQLTAILLIPELLEESNESVMKKSNVFTPFREALQQAAALDDDDDDDDNNGKFTKKSLRKLFECLHECNVADDVLDEMLALCSDTDGVIEALVTDLTLYKEYDDISNHTSRLVKALSDTKTEVIPPIRTPPSSSSSSTSTSWKDMTTTTTATTTAIYTAPFIDYSADTYRRPLFGMQLWTAGIAAYFAYVLPTKGGWVTTKCSSSSSNESSNGCEIASGIASWISIFLQIVTLGLPYILLGSIGNANIATKIYRLPAILISMATIVLVTVLSYFNTIETDVFTTTGNKDVTGVDLVCSDDDLECIENCRLQPETCKRDYVAAEDYFGFSYYLAIILGISILISLGVDIVLMFRPQRWLNGNGFIQRLVLPGTVRQERAGKQAASFRMKQLLQNALDIIYDKTISASSFSKSQGIASRNNSATSALVRFLLLPIKTESVGGIFWSWKRIYNGTIFTEEGIWLNGRLLICNFAQITIFGILIYFTHVFFYTQKDYFYSNEEKAYQAYIESATSALYGNYTNLLGDDYYAFLSCAETILGVDLVVEGGSFIDYTEPWNFISYVTAYYFSYEDAKEALQPCFEEYQAVSTFFDDSNNALTYSSDTLKDLVADFNVTPEKYRVAALLGLVGGIFTVLYIALLLIPSFITTVLKYRSGVKATLNNPEFLRFRYAMDTVTVLVGSAFWGCLFTATGAMAFVIALIFFIGLVPLVIGAAVGFFIILAIRLSVLLLLRCAFFSALYRKKPGAANLMFTVLEVWNIALTLGFVFIRSIKLVVVSILYIARIDTPFLATGVGRFGPVELDSVSIAFEKDILIHEAHRHMLIERFGLLCLIKLYAGCRFGTRAGSAWRLLFVLITMPWLRKYRVDRNTIALEEEIEHLQDDMVEETNVSYREEQMIKMKELQSEKALMTADKDSVDEMIALRKRNEYLEEKIKSLEERIGDAVTNESAFTPNTEDTEKLQQLEI